jgi:hypothetical protein
VSLTGSAITGVASAPAPPGAASDCLHALAAPALPNTMEIKPSDVRASRCDGSGTRN